MKLNHSRYLDNSGTRRLADKAYNRAKETPTAAQKKFYMKLYAMCKEHEIDPRTGTYTVTRMDYAMAIDKLIGRLQEAGVDVKGNNKQAEYHIHIKEPYYSHEELDVNTRIKITEVCENENQRD